MPKDRYPGTALTDAINRRLALTILSLIPVAAAAPAMAEPAVSLQDIIGASERLPEATIYVAREVITMDPARPRAEAVAVVQGRIAAVGSRADIEKLAGTQDYRIDETFRDKVLIAGFVEQHVHPVLSSLTMMSNAVISIEDWDTAQGFSAAVRDPATYEARLKEALAAFDKASGSTFLTWGYHHYFHGQELSRTYLDKLAPDFPVIVWHRSCHEFFLNSRAMEKFKIDQAWFDSWTASQKAQGSLEKGHFFEQGALKLLERAAPAVATPDRMKAGLEYTERYYLQQGVTLCCEPGGFYSKTMQDAINAVHADDATPFNHYFIPDGKSFAALHPDDPVAMIAATRETLSWGDGRSRFLPQQIKFLTDGAIFSQLMMMKDGYTDGHQGAWVMDPDVFSYAFQAYWDADYHIHIHNNGDAGMEVLLANLEQAQRRNPRFDHRTTIVHFGFATTEQVMRAGRLGAIVSANPYYVTALAGRYAEVGIGPERSERMVPLGDARKAGMSISLHSDMPMAPAKPLQLVWSAVNRMTAEGNVVGADQRLDLDTALKAVTIDAAFSIRLENEVGSIVPGKWANFTVLEQSPYDVKSEELKDIKVWGTVLEGRVQPAMGLSAPKKAEAPSSVTEQRAHAQAAPSRSRQPIAFTSSTYRLAASRTGNDLGLCADHTAMVEAFAHSILAPGRS